MSISRDAEAKIDGYERDLKEAYERYIDEVEHIASKAREEILIPYLQPMGWEFLTGNGTWNITDPSKFKYLPDGRRDWRSYAYDKTDFIAKIVDRCLRLELDGSWGNGELALWMQDYTKSKTRNGGGQI